VVLFVSIRMTLCILSSVRECIAGRMRLTNALVELVNREPCHDSRLSDIQGSSDMHGERRNRKSLSKHCVWISLQLPVPAVLIIASLRVFLDGGFLGLESWGSEEYGSDTCASWGWEFWSIQPRGILFCLLFEVIGGSKLASPLFPCFLIVVGGVGSIFGIRERFDRLLSWLEGKDVDSGLDIDITGVSIGVLALLSEVVKDSSPGFGWSGRANCSMHLGSRKLALRSNPSGNSLRGPKFFSRIRASHFAWVAFNCLNKTQNVDAASKRKGFPDSSCVS